MRLKLKRVKWLMQCVLFVYGDLQLWHNPSGMMFLPVKVLAGRTRRSMQAKPSQMCKLGWVQQIQFEPVLLHGTYAFTSSLRFQNSRAGISSSSEIETCQSWNPDDLEIVAQKRYEYQCKLTIAACYFRSICSLNTWLCHMHPVGVSGGLVPREKATCLEFNLKVKSSLFGCPHSQTQGSPWQRCCDAIYPRCFWTCQGVAESSNTLGYLLLFTWGFASPWSRQPLSGWMLLAWLACGMPRFAAQIRQRQLAHA